jgi:hypothetical protein
MRKGWIGEALGKRGPSASYTNYQGSKTSASNSAGPSTNPLPPGNRIGPKNKTRGYNPGTRGNQVNATVDARIGSGPKVGFDRKNTRAPINAANPTSKKKSSGKPGPSRFV